MHQQSSDSLLLTFRKKIVSINNYRRRIGVTGLIKLFADKAINELLTAEEYICLTYDPHQISSLKVIKMSGFIFRDIPLQELKGYVGERGYGLTDDFLAQAGNRGDKCYGVFTNDTLTSYAFYATQATDVNEHLRFLFMDEGCYVYKAFTHPDWRGQKLHSVALVNAMHDLNMQRVGLKGFVTLVKSSNFASLQSFKRVGFNTYSKFWVLGMSRPRIVLSTGKRDSGDCALVRKH